MTMSLIDADALLRHKRKMSGADFGGEFWDEAVLVSDIMNASPVDAVPVVRCKDCKHYEIHKPKVLENCERNGYLIPMKHDDFCSHGERKDDDENG